MKKILTIIALAATLASCSDSLDQTPLGQLSEGNFPATDDDAVALANAAYQPNVGQSTAIGYLTDLSTETTISGENPNGGGGLIGLEKWDPTNSYVESVWAAMNTGVSRADDAIDKVSASTTISPNIKKRVIGEAEFLRAYYMQYLVQFWGEVPIVLHTNEGSGVTRQPQDSVYSQIVRDLQAATRDLPSREEYSEADKGRATSGAAWGFLAKIYLTWSQRSDDLTEAQKKDLLRKSVEAANNVKGYELEENFLANWDKNNANGKEVLFSTQHVKGSQTDGSGGNHLCHCAFSSGFSQSLPHVVISDISYYDAFNDSDQRKAGTYAKTLYDPAIGADYTFERPRYRKYIDVSDPLQSASNRDVNRTILRYAEVLLLKAEALNELYDGPTQEAYDAINQVRRRAFRQPLNQPSKYDIPAGLNHDQFFEHIKQERMFELTYEQVHWLDLVRWHIWLKTMKNCPVDPQFLKQTATLKQYRYPIPQSQRNINPNGLWQNWGYDGYDESKTGADPYGKYEQ